MNREEIQSIITDIIVQKDYHGIIIVPMRVGKTKIIIDALQSFVGSVLWITDKSRLRDVDIPFEFKKWGGDISNVDIICYRSAHKIDKVYDLIILDECQSVTIKTVESLKGKYKTILAATGTFPNKNIKKILYEMLGLDTIYSMSIGEAVDNKIISNFNIEVWMHGLSTDKNVKVTYKDKKSGEQKEFYTSELARYGYLSELIDRNSSMGVNDKFLNFRRLRFLGDLKTKERIVSRYLTDNQDKKILIFTASINQAERITPLSYHSKTDDKCFKEFMNGGIDHLSVVNMADTGITFPHIDEIIILSSNSSNVQSIQRIGRALNYEEGFTARIILLCTKGTIEVEWMKRALKDVDSNKITYIDV